MDFEAYDPDGFGERFFGDGFAVPEDDALAVPDHPSAAGRASGNCYSLDEQVVDADTPPYDPAVIADDPATTFDD